jgi:hypothetical protein
VSVIYIFIAKFVLKIFNYDNGSVADNKKVKAIYTLLEDQIIAEKYDWSQDADFVAELDERVRRYEAGIDRGYTWDEVKASLEQMKRERAERLTV